ncbi:MAG: hypothetical protein KG012_02955 [Deltaproteobacteria bacterium]|nr:hypothetical protein [Deltaproteobacteria bacterium]
MNRSAISKGFFLAGFAAIAITFLMIDAAFVESAVVKHTPNMRMTDLAGRPDADEVEFPGGERVSVRTMRRLETVAPKLRAPGVYRMPPTLQTKPAATGTRINNATDLAAALKRSDNQTVQLPSGRLATVGQIKFVQPQVEKNLGRSLSAVTQRPSLSGTAIKISQNTTEEEWKSILQKPDNTVLESPNGTRITVGELKQAFRTTPPAEREK